MGWAELATVVLVLLISAWLARHASVRARLTLWLSAVLVSAGLFLPPGALHRVIGDAGLAAISSVAGASPWSLEAVAHFIAFMWLALVVWLLRPDLRGWRSALLLAVLAVASELMQGLSPERTTRLDDVGVNLLGGCAGLILGVVAVHVRKRFPRSAIHRQIDY